MSIGLKDLAKKINVSTATISRVVNGSKNVKPETYKYVMKAIEKYGYMPNEVARNLKSNKTQTIGVIVSDIANPYYSSVFSGIEDYAQNSGYSILLCNCRDSYEKQLNYTNLLLQRKVAGLIISPLGDCKTYYKKYLRENIPVVFFDNNPADITDYDCVSIDNYAAAYKLAMHMIDMYGSNIMILSCPESERSTIERLCAFKDAFVSKSYGNLDNQVFITDSSSINSGYEFLKEYLKKGKIPAGILVSTNTTAYGAIKAINESGLSVPNDIGLACFDALDLTGLVTPKLTSMSQPTLQIGKIAIKTLLDKIKDPEGNTIHQKIIVEPLFDIKDSCGYNLRKAIPE